MSLTISRASEILSNFSGKNIAVFGDVMLDEYIWGQANRISPEAPVIVVDADRHSYVPGGAANVVNNVCALGASSSMVGVVGDDTYGELLRDALIAEGADVNGLVTVRGRPTTRKTRVIAHSQQIVRVDHEQKTPLDISVFAELRGCLLKAMSAANAVLLSDYRKGVLDPELVQAVIRESRRSGKVVTGNLKPASILGECELTVLTLNVHEAGLAIGGKSIFSDLDVEDAGRKLLSRTSAENILITRGGNGLTLLSQGGAFWHVRPRPVEVYDTAGAGDTVISTLTLALAAGASPIEAVILANDAAAETVKKVGVATVTREEVLTGIRAHRPSA